MDEYGWFVGIDWGSEEHRVCILDGQRQVVEEVAVEHSGEGLHDFLERLKRICGDTPARVAVGIEIPRGPVVEALAEREFHVYSVNPKQLDRFRDRHFPAGAKDDRRDAFVLADSLRTDRSAFRRVQLDAPLIIRLREFSRLDRDLEAEMRRHANRLRDLLLRYFPQVLELCPAADEPWLWSLLELAPSPQAAALLRSSQVARVLRTHRVRRFTAEQVREKLSERPLSVAPGVVEAVSGHVEILIPMLRLAHGQRSTTKRQIEQMLAAFDSPPPSDQGERREHHDVAILRSLPGVGTRVAAAVLAEGSQLLAARDYNGYRCVSGIGPVTRQSGKSRVVSMRRACSHELRNALHHWAAAAARYDPSTSAYYAELRARGHTRGRALRSVADRLLRILFSMLRNGTLFDPDRARRARPGVALAAGAA